MEVRHDIQVLADAGLISTPVTTWPIPWADIARDVLGIEADEGDGPGVEAALRRVQEDARRAMRPGWSRPRAGLAIAQSPTDLRTFAWTPRADEEISAGVTWLQERLALNLEAAAVAGPEDGRRLRLDGSYLGLTLGNFIAPVGAIDRWWGPGWQGSLILSTNARPIPAIGIERNYSTPFSVPLLRWLGPWRANASIGQMERSDVAVRNVRFFAARASFRPRRWLELSLSRTAQWCGEGRLCGLKTLGDLLIGRDNREDASAVSQEPGNQMAGYDFRATSPWQGLPLALYAQFIGEDEAGGLPGKFLGLMGAEVWGESRWGSHRLQFEYADTSCNFSRREPLFGCAYRNSLYPQGYTFRGRVIGHALGGDGRMVAVGALLVRPRGASLSVFARHVDLNRDSATAHTVSPRRNTLKNVELQYNRAFVWGELGVGVGLDDFEGPLREDSDLRGFVQWRQGF